MATAVLVDGTFFLKRYRYLQGQNTPRYIARKLHWMCCEHLRSKDKKYRRHLYRIFYYDCPPMKKKVHNPITGRLIDYSHSPTALWHDEFHNELKKLRKVALRLGYLNEDVASWKFKGDVLKHLISRKRDIETLTENDLIYEAKQKGVDMRIGLDIASLAFKKQVDQIILVSGDSDFVPAAKLARREGIDFILDPMWAPIRDDLYEHIDGLRSILEKKKVRELPFTPVGDTAPGPGVL